MHKKLSDLDIDRIMDEIRSNLCDFSGKQFTMETDDFVIEGTIEAEKPDCEHCDYRDECDYDQLPAEEDEEEEDEGLFFWGIPDIVKVIFNPPATIIYWEDGDKTVVKCMKGQEYERYAGFCAAVMKKMFGSTSNAKELMEMCDEANWKAAAKAEKERRKQSKEKIDNLDDVSDILAHIDTNVLIAALRKMCEQQN